MADDRLALVLGRGTGDDLGQVALRLVRLGLPVLYGPEPDEALLLASQEAGRVGALVIAPDTDPELVGRIRRAATSPGTEAPGLVAVGPEPDEAVRASLRATGGGWAVWEPYDDGALRYALHSALSLPALLAPRTEPRAPVSAIAWLVAGEERSFGVLYSLSACGAFVEMTRPLPVGKKLRLELCLGELAIRADAEVIYRHLPARSRNLPLGVGLLFQGLGEAEKEGIRALVRQRAQGFVI